MNLLKSSLVTGALLVGSLSSALASKASEHFLPPQPPKVIEPVRLPPNVDRSPVKLRLVIDKSGHPRKITVVSPCDQTLALQLVPAVEKWRFTPATQNGTPIETEIILPLHLVDLAGTPGVRL